jgi:hypothetical protein
MLAIARWHWEVSQGVRFDSRGRMVRNSSRQHVAKRSMFWTTEYWTWEYDSERSVQGHFLLDIFDHLVPGFPLMSNLFFPFDLTQSK